MAQATHNYFLMLDLDIFESPKFKVVRKHFDKGANYLVSLIKLSLEALPSGWISLEDIQKELKENADEFVEVMCHYEMFERVDDMFHSYLVKNKFVKAHPIDKRDRGTIQYVAWRKKVFERDNYTCQKCGEKGGILNAHHIVHWAVCAEKRYEVSNGITLCEKCHRLVHLEERNNGKEKNV